MKCSRCGRCCVFVHAPGEKPKRCKFLIGEIGKKTSCRIYATRLITEIAKGVRCFPRNIQEKITPLNIKECTLLA